MEISSGMLLASLSNMRVPEKAWGGRTDGWMDEQKSPCVLQDFLPFGAAALFALIMIHNHAKQGNWYG